MKRTSNAFSVLQAIAIVASIAIILWSTGVTFLPFAEAANVASFSNTLSDTAPNAGADHTIVFVAPNTIDALDDIVISFEPGEFDLSTIGPEDIDLFEGATPENIGGQWVVSTTSDTITIASAGVATIAGGATTTIRIGLHATNVGDSPATPNSQIGNPGTAGSYVINVETLDNSDSNNVLDSGETQVAIVDTVNVTATVETQFTFTVTGVATGQTVNGTTTGASTTPTSIDFGTLVAGTATTGAQDLSVITNARNGFVVTVQTDQQLSSTNGADIDGFRNGNYDASPVPWEAPSATPGVENTYGHWGLTSDDTDYFASAQTYVSASTSPVEIFAHDDPTDGSTTGEGTTRVGYTVQVSALQEAATDYTANLTYIATPVY